MRASNMHCSQTERILRFYKIIFAQPITSHLIFALDLSDAADLKNAASLLQHLHKEA